MELRQEAGNLGEIRWRRAAEAGGIAGAAQCFDDRAERNVRLGIVPTAPQHRSSLRPNPSEPVFGEPGLARADLAFEQHDTPGTLRHVAPDVGEYAPLLLPTDEAGSELRRDARRRPATRPLGRLGFEAVLERHQGCTRRRTIFLAGAIEVIANAREGARLIAGHELGFGDQPHCFLGEGFVSQPACAERRRLAPARLRHRLANRRAQRVDLALPEHGARPVNPFLVDRRARHRDAGHESGDVEGGGGRRRRFARGEKLPDVAFHVAGQLNPVAVGAQSVAQQAAQLRERLPERGVGGRIAGFRPQQRGQLVAGVRAGLEREIGQEGETLRGAQRRSGRSRRAHHRSRPHQVQHDARHAASSPLGSRSYRRRRTPQAGPCPGAASSLTGVALPRYNR